MWSKARREEGTAEIGAFQWDSPVGPQPRAAAVAAPPPREPGPDVEARRIAIERDAFAKGFAQGEREGTEAATARQAELVGNLAAAIERLGDHRADVLRRSERQLVQLAVAMARRIVQREVSLDRAVLVGMARAALDRLGDQASATVRLNPEDHARLARAVGRPGDGSPMRVEADPAVPRGGCQVDAEFGFIDVSPAAQFDELTRALLETGESERAGETRDDTTG